MSKRIVAVLGGGHGARTVAADMTLAGHEVRLFEFEQSESNLVELTLPDHSPVIGQRVADVPWPQDTALVSILRDARVIVPSGEDTLEIGDELLFVASPENEDALQQVLSPHNSERGPSGSR